MYDRILVPTDGSDAVERAIEEAIDLAALTDAELHALSVVDVGDRGLVPTAEVVTVDELAESAAERAVADVRERAESAGLEVATAVRRGDPREEILAYADETDVDLIVMGTKGRSNIDRVLVGSVTEKVLRNADRPVLVRRLDESSTESASTSASASVSEP